MSILNWKVEFPDQVLDSAGEQTRVNRLACDDNLGDVQAAGYLNQLVDLGLVMYPQDFWMIYYSGGAGLFSVSIDGDGVATLAILNGTGGATGATVVGNLPQFNNTTGVIEDSGIAATDVQLNTNIVAAQSGDIGGAGAGPIDIAVTGLSSASVVVPTVLSSSNPVSILKAVCAANKFSVTFSGDPGAAAVINYVAFKVAQ